jgi:hypothetical protein
VLFLTANAQRNIFLLKAELGCDTSMFLSQTGGIVLQWDTRLCSVIVMGSAMPAIRACCSRHRRQQECAMPRLALHAPLNVPFRTLMPRLPTAGCVRDVRLVNSHHEDGHRAGAAGAQAVHLQIESQGVPRMYPGLAAALSCTQSNAVWAAWPPGTWTPGCSPIAAGS